jgi:hypothetical protein
MHLKDNFYNSKFLNTNVTTLRVIVETVPVKIAYGINTLKFIDNTNQLRSILFDNIRLSVLQTDLGNAIINNDFDNLDNIIIQFFKSFSCRTRQGNVYVTFSEDSIVKFTNICNNFKGKEWDDIVVDFFDALYEFILSGMIGPYKLIDC